MIFNKYIYIISCLLFICCKNDDCSDDGDSPPIGLNIFLKLETREGNNFLDDENFEINQLRFALNELNIRSNNFRILEKNNINVLEFFAGSSSQVTVEYRNEKIGFYNFEISQFTTLEDCTIQVENYKVTSEDGTSLCECIIDEIITLELGL